MGKKVVTAKFAAKYAVDSSGWWSKRSPYAYRVGCWKSILACLKIFKSLVTFEVENGCMVC